MVHQFLRVVHIRNDHERLVLIIQLKTTAIQSSKQAHLAHVLWPRLPHSTPQMCPAIKACAALPPCRELGPKLLCNACVNKQRQQRDI